MQCVLRPPPPCSTTQAVKEDAERSAVAEESRIAKLPLWKRDKIRAQNAAAAEANANADTTTPQWKKNLGTKKQVTSTPMPLLPFSARAQTGTTVAAMISPASSILILPPFCAGRSAVSTNKAANGTRFSS